jgi:hypothetical protein
MLVEEFGESPNIEDLISGIETKIEALEKAESYEDSFLKWERNGQRYALEEPRRRFFLYWASQ